MRQAGDGEEGSTSFSEEKAAKRHHDFGVWAAAALFRPRHGAWRYRDRDDIKKGFWFSRPMMDGAAGI